MCNFPFGKEKKYFNLSRQFVELLSCVMWTKASYLWSWLFASAAERRWPSELPWCPKRLSRLLSSQHSPTLGQLESEEWKEERKTRHGGRKNTKWNKQVSAPNLSLTTALLKVGSQKSSGSGSKTWKLLERVSHFSRCACSPVYPAPSPCLLFHSLSPFFTLGAESLLAQWKLFSFPHQLSITINWLLSTRGGDWLVSGGTTAADYFHLPTLSEVHPPAVDGGREVLHQ